MKPKFDLASSMDKELKLINSSNSYGIKNLEKIAEYLGEASKLLDNAGKIKESNKIIDLLSKIADSKLINRMIEEELTKDKINKMIQEELDKGVDDILDQDILVSKKDSNDADEQVITSDSEDFEDV